MSSSSSDLWKSPYSNYRWRCKWSEIESWEKLLFKKGEKPYRFFNLKLDDLKQILSDGKWDPSIHPTRQKHPWYKSNINKISKTSVTAGKQKLRSYKIGETAAPFMTHSKNKLLLMISLPERPEPIWQRMAALNGINTCSK